MAIELVDSEITTPPNRPYSQAVTAGPIVAVSGQTPIGSDGTTVGVGDPAKQTECVLDRIEQLLGDAGAAMSDVVKVTVYLSDFEHFAAFNDVYRTRFAEPRPARTSVACSLVKPDYLVEIDALAVVER
jgi:reactive intermediate/imine deaminase